MASASSSRAGEDLGDATPMNCAELLHLVRGEGWWDGRGLWYVIGSCPCPLCSAIRTNRFAQPQQPASESESDDAAAAASAAPAAALVSAPAVAQLHARVLVAGAKSVSGGHACDASAGARPPWSAFPWIRLGSGANCSRQRRWTLCLS